MRSCVDRATESRLIGRFADAKVMPKYYCDYCKSYLTHDTLSVRKFHLSGKNHIRYYCNYYEQKAKETGIWDPIDSPYEVNLQYIQAGAPGSTKGQKFMLPPPPSLGGFPNPPPLVVNYSNDDNEAINAMRPTEL